jgi:hypothetical protein
MRIEITGLRERDHLRMRGERLLHDVLERRRVVAVRAAFFDDDGPRRGEAIRCALTVTPRRGPAVRVQYSARTYAGSFNGAIAILKRRLKRRAERIRRRTRFARAWRPMGWEIAVESPMSNAAA